MKVWQLRPLDSPMGKCGWVSYEKIEQLYDYLDALEPGDKMEIRAAEMTREAFDSLPEHQGW